MAQDSDNKKDTLSNSIDLTQLQGFSFAPDWASESGRKRSEEALRSFDEGPREGRRGGRGGGARPGFGRDRRDNRNRGEGGSREVRSGSAAAGSAQPDGGFRRERREGDGRNWDNRARFVSRFSVVFVSQDKPFEMLLKAIRGTCKTYELFDLCRIVLAKENRFSVMLQSLEGKKLFLSVPDSLPFETLEEAVNHVMTHHLERFFEVTEVEVEAPKGNFQFVNRCQITGELLGPPNYHRYQDIVRDHYNRSNLNMSYERFLERVESVREPEVIQAWVDKMKVSKQYRVILPEGSQEEPRVMHTLDEIRFYLTTQRKQQVVAEKDKCRFPGEKTAAMPEGELRQSVEFALEDQRRFPLETANHLRGRLRRCNLHFTKRGPKGITFVCAVKRKHRYADSVFSESLQSLISHIESNPEITQAQILETYRVSNPETLSEEERKQVLQDLRWLVSEGYVTEYADDRLYADKALPMKQSEDKSRQQAPSGKSRDGKKGGIKAASVHEEGRAEEEGDELVSDDEAEVSDSELPEVGVEGETEVSKASVEMEEAPAMEAISDHDTSDAEIADSEGNPSDAEVVPENSVPEVLEGGSVEPEAEMHSVEVPERPVADAIEEGAVESELSSEVAVEDQLSSANPEEEKPPAE